jgi:hypothetical protein
VIAFDQGWRQDDVIHGMRGLNIMGAGVTQLFSAAPGLEGERSALKN